MIHLREKARQICDILSEYGFCGVRVEETDLLEDFDGDEELLAIRQRDYAAFVAYPRSPLSVAGENALQEFVKMQFGDGVVVKRYPACGEFEVYRQQAGDGAEER